LARSFISTSGAWPLLLDLATACRYMTHTRVQFRAMVAGGLFPPGRCMPDGKELWHRGELERAVDRLWQIEAEAQDDKDEADAWRALDAFDPAALRRKGRKRPVG
jgi:hypothetical protein